MRIATLVLALCMLFPAAAMAHGHDEAPAKKAIVLAAFGTSYPDALNSILAIRNKVEKAFPDVPVKLAFTSNIVRNIWQQRAADPAWSKSHPEVPEDVLHVKHPLATIAELQNNGYRDIAVQSLHVFAGEEFHDLITLVSSLRSIRTMKPRHRPFQRLSLGRPALGMPGEAHPYTADIERAVKTLADDVKEAKANNAALLYMGHGNDFFSTGIYAEFAKAMQAEYDYPVFVGCVEGYPSLDDVMPRLKASGKKNILMKPFMVVAGDHATNDMAGDEDDAWKVLLMKAGYKVQTQLRGLGSVDAWADLYVDNLKDAMK
ncbi:sirohydrochlorin cobaltochelatase [Salidesulfovibrio brasiliensis]